MNCPYSCSVEVVRTKHAFRLSSEQGLSLIEMLVSVVIFGFIMLGTMRMIGVAESINTAVTTRNDEQQQLEFALRRIGQMIAYACPKILPNAGPVNLDGTFQVAMYTWTCASPLGVQYTLQGTTLTETWDGRQRALAENVSQFTMQGRTSQGAAPAADVPVLIEVNLKIGDGPATRLVARLGGPQ